MRIGRGMVGLALAAAAGLAGGAALGAGSGNPANDKLLTLTPVLQAQTLGNMVRDALGKTCAGKTAFDMGISTSGASKGYAYWSVRCTNGRSYVVQIQPNERGSAGIIDCEQLAGSPVACFKKLPPGS